jgi:transposase
MTSKQPYPEGFKIEAVKQITERRHRVADVSTQTGVSQPSLYRWIKAYSAPTAERQAQLSRTDEMPRLKAELRRVTEEREIQKKPPRILPGSPGEVCVHEGTRGTTQRAAHVPGHAGAFLRL